MTYGAHPGDVYYRSAAQSTNSARLTVEFEDAVRKSPGDLEIVAAIAIAKVAELELELAVLRGDESPAPSNVHPIRRKEAPSGVSRPGA